MFYFYWQTIKHGMERSGKTWSGGIKRGVMKHVLPLHVLSLHVLSLHTRFYRMPLLLWRRPPQSVIICLVVSRLYKMMPFFPNYFFFLLSFCPPWPTQNVETHLTLDKKGMVLAHVLPLGRPTTKLTRRGIRSVDKLLNVSWFTALFKNTRTLKFAFFAAVIHLSGPLRTENFA